MSEKTEVKTMNSSTTNLLSEAVSYAAENSPFYKSLFENFEKTDFENIPFTTKQHISENNLDFLCVPLSEIADITTTSGTSGEPISIYLSHTDIKRLAKNESDSLALAGIEKGNLVQLMTTTDRQFMAGMAYVLGVQNLGAGIIRIGPGLPELQWKSIFQYQPKYLICVPNFLLTLIEYAENNGIDYKSSSIEGVVCIGEAIKDVNLQENNLSKKITEKWDLKLYSTYASTEMATAFTECSAQNGCHVNNELIHLEVIKEDGTPAQNGEIGEVVATPLQVEAMPLIRYKTGDLVKLYTEPCACGNSSVRIGPVIGRLDQRIKFNGTSIFPNAIFTIFDSFKEIVLYKVVVDTNETGNDVITILLDSNLQNTEVLKDIAEKCRANIKVVPKFEFRDITYISKAVFKKNKRKPEKIEFK